MLIAALQMTSTAEVAENIRTMQTLVAKAADQGAQLVALPEYWCLMDRHEHSKLEIAEKIGEGHLQEAMQAAALKNGVYVVGGTIPLYADDAHVFNSCLLFNPQGQRIARYDKMHLFAYDNGTEHYDESHTIAAGDKVVSVDIVCGQETWRVGAAICFDLRFPALFASMAAVDLWVVPAAFTYTTGSAHWELLLRSRAIDNQSYLLAAAQTGYHQNGRRTFGHSAVVDPWGRMLAVLPETVGVVMGEVQQAEITRVRSQLPVLPARRDTYAP